LTRSRPRPAWIVVYDEPRPPIKDVVFGGVPPGQPLAVFPSTWGIDRLLPVVDAFVQSFSMAPSEKTGYLPRGHKPYAAERHNWGREIMGGYNPYIEAFRVPDLTVVHDDETGGERFEYTRPTLPTPAGLS
jgi:hypothetical protein